MNSEVANIKDHYGFYDTYKIYNFEQFKIPCIYFLIQEKCFSNNRKTRKVVYIGQSKRGIERIFEHKDKNFDYIHIINCKEEELNDLEHMYIEKFEPFYNKSILNTIKKKRFKNAMEVLNK